MKSSFMLAMPCRFHSVLTWVTIMARRSQGGGNHKSDASGKQNAIGLFLPSEEILDFSELRQDQAQKPGEKHNRSITHSRVSPGFPKGLYA